jgi:prohibitin 1
MSIKGIKRLIIGGVTFMVLVFGWFAFTETIQQGHAGVVFSKSSGVQEETLPQGFTFVNPLHKITEYPVSTETITYEKLPLATVDGKPLDVDITIEYFNNVEKLPYIYNKFKGQKPEAIEQNWLKSRAKDSALEVTSKYTILEVFQNREAIKTEILERFSKDVKSHGFEIENVVFGTPQPDENTQKAIQAVVDAQQDLEKLKIDKEKATEIAEKQRIEAKGVADAEIEKAKGTAEANRLIQQSITPELLKKMEMEARIQHGWVEVNGANAVVTGK